MTEEHSDKQRPRSGKSGHGSGMGQRGITRPMARRQMASHHKEHSEEHGMNKMEMLKQHHYQTNWIYWTVILLGFWIMLSPVTFSYAKFTTIPADGRSVWISLPLRLNILIWNDVLCGLLLVIFGIRSLRVNRPLSLWLICGIGVWLNAAPMIFWAPNPFIYLNDTLVGTLLIALTILIPGMPNMIRYMKMGPESPPGWSYNPSSWAQRSILIALGFAGWMVSRYLATFQMGYHDTIWEPFFGNGSRMVLTSRMSESWPISDGALGAFSYTFEFLMGWMGATNRWRTMPWMVTLFGILVIPLGLTHIILVISQPVVVGYWCTFCLLVALIMLPMIPLEVDEVIAMSQFLAVSKRAGKPFWRTFWKGDTLEGGSQDHRTPKIWTFPDQPRKVMRASVWGMSFPVTLLITTLLGLWMIFVPGIFGHSGTLANVEHVAGALTITISIIAMGEVLRIGRFANILTGSAIIIAPVLFEGADMPGILNNLLAGLLIMALSVPRGIIKERYGSWDRFVR